MSSSDAFLQRASETLNAARTLYDAGYYRESVSRAYYAMFYAVEAALLHSGHAVKTHRGTHILFNEYFVKTGLLPEKIGIDLRRDFENRQAADYDLDLDIPEHIARQAIDKAAQFTEDLTRLIQS